MRWAIQTNLGSSPDAAALAQACRDADHEVTPVVRPPFCTDAPPVPNDLPTVFYGSSSLIQAVVFAGRWSPGAWLLSEDYGSWIAHYGAHMLNAEARFLSLAELANDAALASDPSLRFARPSADTKLFAGQVKSARELVTWAKRALELAEPELGPDTALMLAEPVGLRDEWRLFMVEGRVVTGSHYRSNHRLNISPDVPAEVIAFAQARLETHAPAPVVVMDVCRSGEQLYIVEFNGFNSSGFYAADLPALVDAIAAC